MLAFVRNIPIGRKIAVVTGTLLALFAIALIGTLMMMNRAEARFAQADHARALMAAAQSIPEEQLTQRSLQAEYVVFADPALLEEFEASAARADAGRRTIVAAFPDNASITEAVATAAALDEKHDATVFDRIAPAVREGRLADARRAEGMAKRHMMGRSSRAASPSRRWSASRAPSGPGRRPPCPRRAPSSARSP